MMNFYPQYPSRKIQDLGGIWDFCFTEGAADPAVLPEKIEYSEKLSVPGCFDVLPRYAGKRGTAYYRTFVRTTPEAKLLMKIFGLGTWGAIFWDKKLIGIDAQPYAPVEMEFDAGGGKLHELVVVIDNRFDFARQPLVRELYDFYCYGGIYRTIELHELPENSLDRAQVTTTDPAAGKVAVKLLVKGFADGETIHLTYHFDDDAEQSLDLAVSGGKVEFDAQLADKTIWSCENPALHTLEISCGGDTLVERFGLRVVKAEKGKIFLNGKAVKLFGFNRHESHPEFGAAQPLELILEDLDTLKDLGANFIRGSHYPQDQRFLDLCDERGLLVWEETIGWGDTIKEQSDAHFVALQKEQQQLMVKASFNHPCVILWGFLNEADSWVPESRPLFEAMAGFLRAADPTRLVTYASKGGAGDLNYDLADVMSMNCYAGWYPFKEETYRPLGELQLLLDEWLKFRRDAGFLDKPYLISENGAGGIYGWRDRFRGHWSEEYQADYLEQSCDVFLNSDDFCGLCIWVYADFRSYSTSRAVKRPRAFNNKGVVDEYRRPKLAYDVVKKAFHDFRKK
ncbi:MAG: hypothetical protein MJ033_06635 [Victivallaceae bacterium]|nr:hypothetical protein [Victivallaceae bacterium]